MILIIVMFVYTGFSHVLNRTFVLKEVVIYTGFGFNPKFNVFL